ncbi:KGGVGR-motif variant AAA ATPase [Streptomyces anandii]|uniref:KGGVGR-motif variant AAA ATPase n=1 Tax=Streptomyces anandii TaxID=285454 RepID=UPI0037BDDBAC
MSEGRDGRIVTFYSYKGGTGRTMALANVCWILAANGKRVLAMDWDLEAPGLHRFFHPFFDPAVLDATTGVIDMLGDYVWAVTDGRPHTGPWHLSYARIRPHAVSVDWDFPDGGCLDLVSAGRRTSTYSAQVTAFDWDNFYERLGGGQFLDAVRADMRRHYDYVLLDSRTGLSDTADICTAHLPDVLVDCFTLSDQSIDGAAFVAREISERYGERGIRILPVPMRIDEGEKDRADAGRALARMRFDGLPDIPASRVNAYWASAEIPYRPYYAYEETLAIFGDQPGMPASLLSAFERLTSLITEGEVTALPSMEEDVRLRYRDAFVRARPHVPRPVVCVEHAPEDESWARWAVLLLAAEGFQVLSRQPGDAEADGSEAGEAVDGAGAGEAAGEGAYCRTLVLLSSAYVGSTAGRAQWEAWTSARSRDAEETARDLVLPVVVGDLGTLEPLPFRSVVNLVGLDEDAAAQMLLRALIRS